MSFSTIPSFLYNQIELEKYKIDSITKLKEYNLCITGNIGVGKSTTLEFIKLILQLNKVQFNLFPEYIQTETGKLMFELVNTNRISKRVFQNYILDNWIELYKNNMVKHHIFKINLYERLVEDCVKCFGKISLDQFDYEYLLKRYYMSKKEFNFIEYNDCEIVEIENINISQTIEQVVNVINDDLRNETKYRVVKLKLNDDLNKERIQKRARIEENNNLNYDIINYYNEL
jgi:broad-specificity NMP kinase